MTAPTNTQLSFSTYGNREDLTDEIHMISPLDTIFFNRIDSVEANGTKHEWQIDTLAAAVATNYVVEGDSPSADAFSATTRLYNTTQLSDKIVIVSSRQRAVKTAGRGDEMAYQLAKRAKELKRDVEMSLVANNIQVTGDGTVASECAGIESWIATNYSCGAGGSVGGAGTTAKTDGTARAFTEDLFLAVLEDIWEAGGDPDIVLVRAFNKRKMSTFTGNATRTIDAESGMLQGAIDFYKSDFGVMEIWPSRYTHTTSCLILQSDMWKFAVLQPWVSEPLAKTGHADQMMLSVEYTLEACNEAASGAVFDLSTS